MSGYVFDLKSFDKVSPDHQPYGEYIIYENRYSNNEYGNQILDSDYFDSCIESFDNREDAVNAWHGITESDLGVEIGDSDKVEIYLAGTTDEAFDVLAGPKTCTRQI